MRGLIPCCDAKSAPTIIHSTNAIKTTYENQIESFKNVSIVKNERNHVSRKRGIREIISVVKNEIIINI